jgi:hypothetical protein
MKVYLNITGGPIPYGLSGQVDMADLPSDLAQRVETSLQRDYMENAISADRELPLPDEQVYELVVMDPSGKEDQARYVFADSQAAPELIDLVDELRLAITDQQIKQVQEAGVEPAQDEPTEAEEPTSSRTRSSRKR